MNTINNMQTNMTFGSTVLPYSKKVGITPVVEKLNKYFEVTTFKTAEQCKKAMTHSQAGMFMETDGIHFLGKDIEADKFIYKTLKDIPGAKYLNDGLAENKEFATIAIG